MKPSFQPKIINDPVYGFVSIDYPLVLAIINHPYFQRLRRIKQLGLTNLVYPGALHTRFHHAIGAMHLMQQAVQTLKTKGIPISPKEEEAALIAILLHDIGHGPFSHALENTIVQNISHEHISSIIMHALNKEFKGKLELAIDIFENNYQRKFFHQLVSSQLDVDRLDYLQRDSFFTGVNEGVIGTDRIIKMITVVKDKLVVEQKGIYSIEKFLIARRLMYWQVYLHKTVLSAENMLVNILKRAKELVRDRGYSVFATPSLYFFLKYDIQLDDFIHDKVVLNHFTNLDDNDIITSIKVWANSDDKVLSLLCKLFIHRKLFKITLQKKPFTPEEVQTIRDLLKKQYPYMSDHERNYLVIHHSVNNAAYVKNKYSIEIYDGKTLEDIADASDNFNIRALSKVVKKYFLCYDRSILDKIR